MNQKKAKAIRQYLRSRGVDVTAKDFTFRWPIRLSPTCGRGVYHATKRKLARNTVVSIREATFAR